MPDAPLIVAHRGLSATHPEHTRAAYEHAVPHADAFECDVRLTRDGTLVCWHDGTLQRTSDATGRVSAVTWDAMRRATPAPLAFEDLLDIALESGRGLFIETKHPVRYAGRVERELAALLTRRARDIERSGIEVNAMSFSALAVRRIRRLPASGVQLVDKARVAVPAWHAGQVGVAHGQLTQPYVAAAHGRGQRVLAWTVNDPAVAVRLADWGVDAIITDCADVIRAALTR